MLDADRRACMAETDAQLQLLALRPGMGPGIMQPLYNGAYGDCMGRRGNLVATVKSQSPPAAAPTAGNVTYTGLRDSDSVAARQTLSRAIDSFRRACPNERINVATTEVSLSQALDARLVELSTPDGGSCFGQPGQDTYLLSKSGADWTRLLAAEPGAIKVATTCHGGALDLDLYSLGTCVYGYRWNGSHYVQASAHDCPTSAPPTMRTLPSAIRGRQ